MLVPSGPYAVCSVFGAGLVAASATGAAGKLPRRTINGGGSLVIGNNAGDNKIYLEMYNSTNDGSPLESLITVSGKARSP